MFPQNTPQQPKSSFVVRSIEWGATGIAVIGSLLGTPKLYALTHEFVLRVALSSYGGGASEFVGFVYLCCLYLTIFAFLRAALSALLIAAMARMAVRLF